MYILPNFICSNNAIFVKILMPYITILEKNMNLYRKLMTKHSQRRKNNVGSITMYNLKIYHKVSLMKTVYH